jgi:hypothetical protein
MQQVAIREVTPEMATQWLETMPYDQQRNVSDAWVDYIAEEMRREHFQQGTKLTIAILDGRPLLIDGQHRLWAVVRSELPQSFIVYEVEARDKEHIAWLYATTDIGRKRPPSELTKGMGIASEYGITQGQVDALAAAVTFMKSGLTRQDNKGSRLHPDDLLLGVRLYAPYATQLFDLVTGDTIMGRASRRAATLVAAVLTMRYVRPSETAMEFWRGVVKDDGIKAGDPRKFANRHLLNSSMMNGRRTGATVMTPAKSVRILAACFNAYVAGREIAQTPKVLDEAAPINIVGVPKDPAKWLS